MVTVKHVDATPQKRLFLSIIADYDLKTSICELVDNAIDHWIDGGRLSPLKIEVFVNRDRQIISVKDNAGGIPASQLQLLIAPGASREKISDELIGNFGVGGKRAGIALGERVEVRTRFMNATPHKFEINDEWLSHEDWNVDVSECSNLEPGSTVVRVTELRQGFEQNDIDALTSHLSETYAYFQSNQCSILLNGSQIRRDTFDNWAYPASYSPISGSISFSPDGTDKIAIKITGGLILDRNPKEENYGVYFYCNKRLVLAHEKSHHVGFMKGFAGVPHPDASLCRVIVELSGLPSLMPWNSSKSGINWSHPVFLEIRERIFETAKRYSTLSRRLKNDRETEIYPYDKGKIEPFNFDTANTGKELVKLPTPRGRKKNFAERILDANEQLFATMPWVRGLVEAVGIADYVSRRKISSRNRLALIILDSTFEIALKEYLVHQDKKYFSDDAIAKLFKSRNEVLKAISSLASISKRDIDLAKHYANLRNKLIHERATVDIPDSDIESYRGVVDRTMKELFGVKAG